MAPEKEMWDKIRVLKNNQIGIYDTAIPGIMQFCSMLFCYNIDEVL